MALEMARVPATNEPGTETLIAFQLGTAMHDFCQDAMDALWTDFEREVVVDLRPMGFNVSGHADWVYSMGEIDGSPRRLVGELKTMKSYPFKIAQRDGEPKLEHVAQAAIYAIGLEADGIHMVYICKETGMRRDGIHPGQILEWILSMDDVIEGETIRDIGMGELYRMQRVWDRVQQGVIPERDIPGYGPVDNPPLYHGEGHPWNCRYCNHRDACAPLPTEGVPVTVATTPVQEAWNPPVGDGAEAAA